MAGFDEIVKKVRQLVAAQKVQFLRKHIEEERAYREIYIVDVNEVLKNGKVSSVNSDKSFRWVGTDNEGRQIQLVCRMADANNNDTLEVLEAEELFIRTAYEVGTKKSDDEVKKEWLEKNKNWRLKQNGCVERVRK